MADTVQSFLRPAEGFRSREAASFYTQLEDQARILHESIQGMTPQELEWQPERGMNTIGMLLAHNAIVDVFWTQIANGSFMIVLKSQPMFSRNTV